MVYIAWLFTYCYDIFKPSNFQTKVQRNGQLTMELFIVAYYAHYIYFYNR